MDLHSLIRRALILSRHKCSPQSNFHVSRQMPGVSLCVLNQYVFRRTWLVVSKPGFLVCEGQRIQAFAKGSWLCNFFFPEKIIGCGFKVNVPKAGCILLGSSLFPGRPHTASGVHGRLREQADRERLVTVKELRPWVLRKAGSFVPAFYLIAICGKHPLRAAQVRCF